MRCYGQSHLYFVIALSVYCMPPFLPTYKKRLHVSLIYPAPLSHVPLKRSPKKCIETINHSQDFKAHALPQDIKLTDRDINHDNIIIHHIFVTSMYECTMTNIASYLVNSKNQGKPYSNSR